VTINEFFALLENYNQAIWPMPLVAYGLAVLALIFIMRSGKLGNRMVSGVLAFFWLWTGLIFQVFFLAPIEKTSYASGAFLVLQGILLIWYGVFKHELTFKWRLNSYGIIGGLIILYSLIAYPVFGTLAGHQFPRVPVFGLMPCPTAMFTAGILLLAEPGFPRSLLLIPFVTAMMGMIGALMFRLPEDFPVLPLVLIASLMAIHHERQLTVTRMKSAASPLS
jgi:hypothetical protein